MAKVKNSSQTTGAVAQETPAKRTRRLGEALPAEKWPTEGRQLIRQGESLRDLPRPDSLAWKGNRVTRWIGWTVLRLHGWDVRGWWPTPNKVIAVAGPHTCNFDAWLAIWCQMAINTRFNFFIKKEAFAWPFGYLWRWMGGVPVNRRNPRGLVEAVMDMAESNDKFVFAVTPEGTRAPPKRLKSGLFRLAKELDLPMMTVTWDFDTKTIWFEEPLESVETFEEWEQQLYRYFEGIRGGEGYWMGVDQPNGRRIPDADCPRPFTPGKEPV